MILKRLPLLALLALLALFGLATLQAIGLRITLTGSVPRGFYFTRTAPLHRGLYVALCLPLPLAQQALERGYLAPGRCPIGHAQPLLKRIAALPGDLVQVTPEALIVNGQPLPNTRRLDLDSSGRRITSLPPGLYPVLPETLWVIADADRRSWDSRYFGPLPYLSVRETLAPWVTWP